MSGTTLNFDGYNINDGTLISNGGVGSSLTINVNQNGAAPGYLLNYGDIEADAGNSVTIAVNGTSELFNAGLVYADGGTVVVDGGAGIAGGYAPMMGGIALVGDGGTLDYNAGFPSGTKGSNPVFAFYDGHSGDTLKLDHLGQFGGRILGFEHGDTIDLGSALSIGTIAVTGDGQVLLESNTGSVIATLVLSSGNYTPGSYAVTTVAAGTLVAGGFTLTTGGDGNTLLTTDVVDSVWNVGSSGTWQQAANWSSGVVPGANDTAVIGVDSTTGASGTISPFVLTTGSVAVDVGALVEAGNRTTLQVTSDTTVGLGSIAYGIQQVAGKIEITGGNTLTTTFLRQLGPGADLLVDSGGVFDITGHSDLGFANNGTLTETTVVNGTTFANGDTLGLFVTGAATVDGGLINAGQETNTSNGTLISTGGFISIGQDGGGTPARMTVENGGTVIDTYGYLSSDPTSFGVLTLTGAGTTWDDVGDPTDLYNTRGFMIVGGNNQAANQPSPLPAGTAQLVVENNAVLNEALYGVIGAQVDSAGSATVTAGGIWNVGTAAAGGFVDVGDSGSGTLVIGAAGTVNILPGTGTFTENGTVFTDAQGIGIAHHVGSDGTVVVDGGQLNVTIGNTVAGSGVGVGQAGHGVLDILAGGTVAITNGGISAGSSAIGVGTIVVGDGVGTSLLDVVGDSLGGGMSVGKSGTGTLYVNQGGEVTIAVTAGVGAFDVGHSAGSFGYAEIDGGIVSVSGNPIYVGNSAGASGVFVINSGQVTDLTNSIFVGNAGTGTLDVNGGTVSSHIAIYAGYSAGSRGLIDVTGGTLTAATAGLTVGNLGTGELELSGGTVSVVGGIQIGNSVGAVGTVVVTGGTLTSTGAGMNVGNAGTGFLSVNGGIVSVATGMAVGLSSTANGSVTVSHGLLSEGAALLVGGSGTGTLDVGAGGTVTAQLGLTIGNDVTGSGIVIVNGGTLRDAGVATVGQFGTGTLVVMGGGTVAQTGLVGDFSIGMSPFGPPGSVSHGTVIVNGGTLDTAGTFTVGAANAVGTLLVEGGGLLRTGSGGAIIDASGSGSANATVSGGTWALPAGNLVVGDTGSGSLDVNGGGGIGVVNAGAGEIVIGQSGSVAQGIVSVESGGTLIGGTLVVSDATSGTTGSLTVGGGGLVEVGAIAEDGGGSITVGGTAAAELSASGLVDIGQSGTGALLTINNLGTVTGTGGNTLEILSNSTASVNGGTLGGFGTVEIGGASGGTLDVTGAGTVESTSVVVGNGGLLQAGSLTIDNAITQGGIESLSVDTGGTVLVSTITLGTGGVINLNGGVLDPITMDVTGPGTISGSGTLDANISFASSAGTLIYNGGGTLEITGTVSGGGTLGLGSGAIQLDTAPGSTPTVTYGPGTETLILGSPTIDTTSGGPNIFTAMTDVGLGDRVDFGSGITIDSISYTPVAGGENVTLDVTQGKTDGFITLNDVQFTGGATKFNIITDGSNGDSAIQAACYAAGTRIATVRGEIAVEDLRVGDLVRTVLGEASAPIIWIGRREVDCARHPKPRQVWPVRVAAGAFGPGRPHTDLLLSPDHAVYVNDVLIPIQHLINDTTIRQIPVDRVTYYHVELPQHDVVLAEGLPAESYLDMRDGSNYANRPGPTRLYPDFSARMWEAFGCAPLIVTGPELMTARALVGGFTSERDAA